MTAPNMATITSSLERSLQNCSLNQTTTCSSSGIATSSSSDDTTTTTLDLSSHLSLPYHWQRCLDLKTGEMYYINWSTGNKVKEDPRTTASEVEYSGCCDYYSEDEEENDDSSTFETEESSSESSSPVPSSSTTSRENFPKDQSVLVVTGCKSCFMYFMVPKQVQDCPKCSAQLLHFDP